MLITLALLASIFIVAAALGLQPVIGGLGILCLGSIFALGIGQLSGYSWVSCAGGTVLACLTLRFLRIYTRSPYGPTKGESVRISLLLLVAFTFFHFLCLRWPEFISIGERLRDYSILSAVIENPLSPQEPWLPDFSINYYLTWYRFGAYLSHLLGVPVFEVYHILIAFSLATYFSLAALFCERVLRFKPLSACLCGIMIACGSNPMGLITAVVNDNWWVPSRVIAGTIDEFPSWSFLLGDAHPHYLNLPFIPYFLLLFFLYEGLFFGPDAPLRWELLRGKICFLAATLFCALFVYSANAWEVPIVGLLGLGLTIAATLTTARMRTAPPLALSSRWYAAFFFLFGLGSALLFVFTRNIQPLGAELNFVRSPVANTTVVEFLLYWGFPVLFSASALIWRSPKPIASFLLLFLSLFLQQAAAFIVALLFLHFSQLSLSSARNSDEKRNDLLMDAVGIVALLLLLIPEIIYLNDSYGPEIERMNTIFKITTANWVLMHLFALSIFARTFSKYVRGDFVAFRVLQFGILSLSLISFFSLATRADARRIAVAHPIEPRSEGLSALDEMYPGSAETIRALRERPRGQVLEAQGPPYTETTFIATLAGQPAYIGWVNHIELLYPGSDEAKRRAEVTEYLYSGDSCELRSQRIRQERIRYVILGTREKRAYPSASFTCLTEISRVGDYTVYEAL